MIYTQKINSNIFFLCLNLSFAKNNRKNVVCMCCDKSKHSCEKIYSKGTIVDIVYGVISFSGYVVPSIVNLVCILILLNVTAMN